MNHYVTLLVNPHSLVLGTLKKKQKNRYEIAHLEKCFTTYFLTLL